MGVEIHNSKQQNCPLCKGRFYTMVIRQSFTICHGCAFKLDHEGRTSEQQDSHTLKELVDRVSKLETLVHAFKG